MKYLVSQNTRALALATLISSLTVSQSVRAELELLAPAPGSAIWDSSATFVLKRHSPHLRVWVSVGTEPDASDIFQALLEPSAESFTLHDLPDDRTIYLTVLEERPPEQADAGLKTYKYRFNIHQGVDDRDLDGIMDDIDPDPDVFNAQKTFFGEDYVLTVHGSGRVVNLQSDRFYESANQHFGYGSGKLQPVQIDDITKTLYRHLGDVYDFIVLANLDFQGSGPYAGVFSQVKNDVRGIGSGIVNETAFYGSKGKLQGVIHQPGSVDINTGPTLHEMVHAWGNYLSVFPETDHWGASDVGGQLGGWKPGSLTPLGNNLYSAESPQLHNEYMMPWFLNANGGNRVPFSDLELYLMGMISKEEITRDFTYANGFRWVDQARGIFQATGFSTVSIDDIIRTHGQRIPDHKTSQKQFNVLHVILSNRPMDISEWKYADKGVYQFAYPGSDGVAELFNFWEATGGRGSLVMDLAMDAVTDAGGTRSVTIPLVNTSGQQGGAYISCPQINLANSLVVTPDQPADLSCSIQIPAKHVAKNGSFYVVAELVGQALFMMDSSGEYQPWDGNMDTLSPALAGRLPQKQDMVAFRNLAFSSLGINEGAVKLYFGYAPGAVESLEFTANGILVLVKP